MRCTLLVHVSCCAVSIQVLCANKMLEIEVVVAAFENGVTPSTHLSNAYSLYYSMLDKDGWYRNNLCTFAHTVSLLAKVSSGETDDHGVNWKAVSSKTLEKSLRAISKLRWIGTEVVH